MQNGLSIYPAGGIWGRAGFYGLVLLLMCSSCLYEQAWTPPDQGHHECDPKAPQVSSHPDWQRFVQQNTGNNGVEGCLQIGWGNTAGQPSQTKTTPVTLSKDGRIKTMDGVTLPPASQGQVFRFRLFVYTPDYSGNKQSHCQTEIAAPNYDCLGQQEICLFYYEFRPQAKGFTGETQTITGAPDQSCKLFLRRIPDREEFATLEKPGDKEASHQEEPAFLKEPDNQEESIPKEEATPQEEPGLSDNSGDAGKPEEIGPPEEPHREQPDGGLPAGNNTKVGEKAGQVLSSQAKYNTLVGHSSGSQMTAGAYNTFVGSYSGNSTTTGQHNTFMGRGSGASNITGSFNTYYGTYCGVSNTISHSNTFIGAYSNYNKAGGSQNVFVGNHTGYNTHANNNTFAGQVSGYYNTTGTLNSYTGYASGVGGSDAQDNTFSGASAGQGSSSDKNTYFGGGSGQNDKTGHNNTLLGQQSGHKNESGYYNTFVGQNAGYNNSSGNNNTFVGEHSGYQNLSGGENTCVGVQTAHDNNIGSQNSFVGYASGTKNTSGTNNTFVGSRSGENNTTGSFNTAAGFTSGYSNRTGSHNVFLGHKAGYHETGSHQLYIANSDTKTPLIHGSFTSASVIINGTLAQMSDRRLKQNIRTLPNASSKLMKLRGVSFQWKQSNSTGQPKGRQIGLIAKEVEKVIPEAVVTNSNGYKAVSYTSLVAVLVETMKAQQRLLQTQTSARKHQVIRLKRLQQILQQQQQKLTRLRNIAQALRQLRAQIQSNQSTKSAASMNHTRNSERK